MSRYTLFLDLAGRVSKATHDYEFLTCAGVALESCSVEHARELIGSNLPKWRSSDDAAVRSITEFLVGASITSFVLRIQKREPAWSETWADAEEFCNALASRSRKRAGFAKAAQFIRYFTFAECVGRLSGECIRVNGYPRIMNHRGLSVVELSAVCDSDIQGADNIKAFDLIWEMFDKSPQKFLATIKLSVTVRSARLATEQEEPLLLCPDYVAGLFQCEVTPTAKPDRVSDTVAQEARRLLREAGKLAVIDKAFDIPYRAVFGKGELGQELWNPPNTTPAPDC